MNHFFRPLLLTVLFVTGNCCILEAAPTASSKQEQTVSVNNNKVHNIPQRETLADKVNERLQNNSSYKLFYTGGVLLITLIIGGIIGGILRRKRKGEKQDVASKLGELVSSPIICAVFITGIYISIMPFLSELSDSSLMMAQKALKAILCALFAWLLYRFADLLDFVFSRMEDETSGNQVLDALIVGVIRKIVKVVVVIIAILFIGQNILDMNITTLLAGAGVAGLAVAFAAQDTIANFFGSIMLIVDKPFGVGDFVKVDAFSGIVERVGLRSTSLRTLDGHVITLPNKNVAGTPVENVSKRPFIKKIINLGLTYDTTPAQMRRAMEVLHEIFDNHENMNPEQPPVINFTEFKDFSLNIQVIVWFYPNDFMLSIDWMSRKNIEILERFNAEGLDFAFPTSTTYLAGDAKHPFSIK